MANEKYKVSLVRIEKFIDLPFSFREEFNSRAHPYKLPNFQYKGSFEPEGDSANDSIIYIAMPIKNQESIIYEILESLFAHIKIPFRIGIMLDNCTDNSELEVIRFLQNSDTLSRYFRRIDILESSGELFETTCENILFQFCDEELFMSLQADIHFTDNSFINRAKKAFEQNPSLMGISGRAIVPFEKNNKTAQSVLIRGLLKTFNLMVPKTMKFKILGPFSRNLGYFGDTSNYPFTKMKFTKNQFLTVYPGEALIRGPLIWNAKYFAVLGGLDDLGYFLGRDDCDLALRGNMYYETFVGFLPCDCYSDPKSGTTRKPRSSETLKEIKFREDLTQSKPGTLSKYWSGELQVKTNDIPLKPIRIKT